MSKNGLCQATPGLGYLFVWVGKSTDTNIKSVSISITQSTNCTLTASYLHGMTVWHLYTLGKSRGTKR